MLLLYQYQLASFYQARWPKAWWRQHELVVVVAALTARVRPDVQVVDVGQSATFLCVVSGSPAPSVAWYKDGAPVNSDDDQRVTLSDDRRQLSVRGVLRQDAGLYQCLVENSDDSAQSLGRLIIGGRRDASVTSSYKFSETIHHPRNRPVRQVRRRIANKPTGLSMNRNNYTFRLALPVQMRCMLVDFS